MPICYGDRVVVFVGLSPKCIEVSDDSFAPGNSFVPISVPIRGEYDEYGGIIHVDKTPGVEVLEKLFDMDIETIVRCAERISIGAENQIDHGKITSVIGTITASDMKLNYIMDHEAIFNRLVFMSNVAMKDFHHWTIPHDNLEMLGYKQGHVENDGSYDIIIWEHDTLPTLKERNYVWLQKDFGDYEKTSHTITKLCERLGCEVPESFNEPYFENCFKKDVVIHNEDINPWEMNVEDRYSFMEGYVRYGLFHQGETMCHDHLMLRSKNGYDWFLDEKYMADVVALAAFIDTLRKLEMTWGVTNYYNQDVEYGEHIEFLEACLSVAKEKQKEHEYFEENE